MFLRLPSFFEKQPSDFLPQATGDGEPRRWVSKHWGEGGMSLQV